MRRVFIVWGQEPPEPSTESRLLSLALRLGFYIAALWLADRWVTGVKIEGGASLIAMATILWAVNSTINPLVQFASCALTCLTLGLFALVINAAMLALAAWIAGGFGVDVEVDGFWAAFLGALLVAFVTTVLDNVVGRPIRRALA
ncbi:MAG: phage holin family protein [Dehalococcoidia bacterium]